MKRALVHLLAEVLAGLFFLLFTASATAQLLVIDPVASTNVVGDTIALSVHQIADTNYPNLTYRWFREGVALADTDRLRGTATETLTIEDVQQSDSGTYSARVLVNGALLAAPTSAVYILDVPEVQGIRQETAGAAIRLIAEATGGLLSYQWMWQGSEIPGATNRILLFANAYTDANAGYYSVRVTNLLGTAVSASPGILVTKAAPSGTYQGLFYDTNGVTIDSSGFVQFTINGAKRSFSGALFIGRSRYPFSGKLSITHETELTVVRRDGTPLFLAFQLISTNNDSKCFGIVSGEDWTASLAANVLYYSSRNPTPLAARYNVALLNTNALAGAPNGTSIGQVIVSPRGTVSFKGTSAEGTTLAQSCGLSRSGDWPLWSVSRKGGGQVIGWLRISASGANQVRGDQVVWTREADPGSFYAEGYSLNLSSLGSKWAPPENRPYLGFTSGIASFFGGDLFVDGSAIWDLVKVSGREGRSFAASDSPERVKISISKSNGGVKGDFTDPVTGTRQKIFGVALPLQGTARGFFRAKQASGNFILTPAP